MIVDELKKAILQYAVQGELTNQLKTDSNVREIINNIIKEKKDMDKIEKLDRKVKQEEMIVDTKFPSNWIITTLGTISKNISKGTTPSGGEKAYKDSGIGFIRAENVNGKYINTKNLKYIDVDIHNTILKRSILEEKDILICIAGTLGRCSIVDKNLLPLNTNQAVAFIRLMNYKLISVEFLQYIISSDYIQNQLINQKKITAIPNLTLEIIANCKIPLPPIEEQQRIVEKIEELFNRLDELKDIEVELDVLKSKLPDELKKSILNSFYDIKNIKYRKMKDIVEVYTGNSISVDVKKSKFTNIEKGFNYIATKDVEFNNTVNYNNGVRIPFDEPKFRYADANDVLLCIEGGSAGRKIAILSEKVCFGNKLCCFHSDKINNRFLYYYLQSPLFQKIFRDNLNGIIGGVSINKIKDIQIPLPSIEEQQRIVEKLDYILPLIESL